MEFDDLSMGAANNEERWEEIKECEIYIDDFAYEIEDGQSFTWVEDNGIDFTEAEEYEA